MRPRYEKIKPLALYYPKRIFEVDFENKLGIKAYNHKVNPQAGGTGQLKACFKISPTSPSGLNPDF